MKRFSFTLIFICLITNIILSQSTDWANVGTTWRYEYFGYGVEGFTTYEVEKDTIINGKNCSKVTVLNEYSNFGDSGHSDEKPPFFTYEEDSVIFFSTQNQFDTLMNLQAAPGDNWKLTNQSCTQDRNIEVLDTGRTTINGCENKWISYSYQGFSSVVDTFYSYYGSIKYAFAYFDYCQQNAVDKPVSINLRCYDDGNCIFLNGTPDCESLNVKPEMLKFSDIKLYPNPAGDNITVEISEEIKPGKLKYSITDLSGKIIHKGDLFNSNIDVSILGGGVYFVSFKHNGEYLSVRKVLIE